jgi:multidrug efflux system membrane fusion protein
MAVRVAFRGEGPGTPGEAGVLVPKSVVATENGRDYVWTIKDGKATRRNVTRGPAEGDELTLGSGLKAGEPVVIEGGARLRDGARVRETQR